VFVVDAYTRRLLDRHQIVPQESDYEEIRRLFESALLPMAAEEQPADISVTPKLGTLGAAHPRSPVSTGSRPPLVQVYNEMHALIVGVGKNYCRKTTPACENCPLQPFLHH
jgi:endonuclease-3 related protein